MKATKDETQRCRGDQAEGELKKNKSNSREHPSSDSLRRVQLLKSQRIHAGRSQVGKRQRGVLT